MADRVREPADLRPKLTGVGAGVGSREGTRVVRAEAATYRCFADSCTAVCSVSDTRFRGSRSCALHENRLQKQAIETLDSPADDDLMAWLLTDD